MQLYINKKNIASRASQLLGRRYARSSNACTRRASSGSSDGLKNDGKELTMNARDQRERMRQMGTQQLVSRVEAILAGVGLTQAGNSVAGGRTTIIPEVISVAEKPMRFMICPLPGQIPDDFVKAAPRIAYNLNVAKVHVDELGPSLIQLRLEPKIRRNRS